MPTEQVIIKTITPESIKLIPETSGTCHACQLKPTCGQYMLQGIRGSREILLPAKSLQNGTLKNFQIGQSVSLEIPASTLVKLSCLLYFVPLVLLVLVTMMSSLWGLSESFTIILAFAVLGVSFYFLHQVIQKKQLPTQLGLELKPLG